MKYYISFILLIITCSIVIYFYPELEAAKIDFCPKIYITSKYEIGNDYSYVDIELYSNNKKQSYKNVLIKLRGNSTRYYDKRPYTLKFNEDVNLLNLKNHKRFNLISNGFDETLMHNKIAYDFAYKTQIPYVVSSQYIDLYLNNEYIGNYLLTDKIELNEVDYLLEMETVRDQPGETYFKTNKYGWRFNVHEGYDLNKLAEYFDNLEIAIESKNYSIIKKYIDIESIIDSYIMEEYFKDVDCNFSSLYFYIKDNKLYAGPPWDFDLSMGFTADNNRPEYNNINGMGNNSGHSYEGFYCNHNIYGELLKVKQIKRKLIDRYEQLQPSIKDLYTTDHLKLSMIDIYNYLYRKKFEKNNVIWKQEWIDLPYDNRLLYLKDWLEYRNEWLLKEFHIKI